MSVAPSHQPDPFRERFGRYLAGNPMIPLIVFLVLLVAALEVMRPGIVTPFRAGRDGLLSMFWIGNLVKFAIPLAMLAACQVLTMLTAGIDLSVGIIATVMPAVAKPKGRAARARDSIPDAPNPGCMILVRAKSTASRAARLITHACFLTWVMPPPSGHRRHASKFVHLRPWHQSCPRRGR